MSIRIYILVIFALFLWSCDNDSRVENEIEAIELDFVVERFDKAYADAEVKDLPKLKQAYPFLFSKQVPDSIWIKRMNDTLQDMLLNEVNKAYPDFNEEKEDLRSLFKHLKYYDKTFTVPRVVTLTNDVDYRNKVIVTDSLLLIALDNFLGENHEFYQNIPRYLAANMQSNQIVPEVAEDYAEKYAFQTNRKTLLDEMIYFGKLLYFKDVMIPFVSDEQKIGYTEQELKWAEANESPIWSHFIENAPYSKFYLELDNESPGRLGQYIGWQIVRAYAENTDENIMSLMQKEPEEIFNKSKFKPKQ